MAHLLKLALPKVSTKKLKEFDVEFSDEIKSAMSEITVKPEMLANGKRIMDISLPDRTLVVMVKRNYRYFIPRGNTQLEVGDSVLVITDDEEGLKETYRQLGI